MKKNRLELRDLTAEQKRQWVRVTRACNNQCLFCHDIENQNNLPVPFAEIIWNLAEGRRSGAERVVISGGEPTVNPRIFEIIKQAKKMGYKHVQIITNGRMLAYGDFGRKLKNAGLDEITFSLHSHLKGPFEKITRVKGSYIQSMRGLSNALKLNFIVSVDIVINKLNFKKLKETLEFFIRMGVFEFDLLYLIPFGNAWKNKDALFISPGKAKKYLARAFALSSDENLYIWTNRLPAELLEGYEYLIQNPHKLSDEISGRKSLFADYAEKNKIMPCFGKQCRYCFLKNFCLDFIKLKRDNFLESKSNPNCLKSGKVGKKTPFKFRKKIDIGEFLNFYIKNRYFVKRANCENCSENQSCAGVSINEIRKKGFKILTPINR